MIFPALNHVFFGDIRSLDIRTRWERRGDSIEMTVEVPAGTTATVEALGKTKELVAGKHQFKL